MIAAQKRENIDGLMRAPATVFWNIEKR